MAVSHNSYNELWCANLSNYVNRSSNGGTGLQFLCNSNAGNTHDIAARGNLQAIDGIRANQGDQNSLVATGNTMSTGALYNIYNYTTEVQPINYYYSNGEMPITWYGANIILSNENACSDTNPNDGYPNNDNDHTHGHSTTSSTIRVAHFLQDPYCANRDSLNLALSAWVSPYSDLLQTNLMVADSNFNGANSLYNAIVAKYSLTGTEATEFTTWGRRLLDLNITLRMDNRLPDSLSAAEVENLEGIADSAALWARQHAQAWLSLYDGRSFLTQKLFPEGDTGSEQRMIRNTIGHYYVTPNPVHENIQIRYSKSSKEDALFVLHDALGRVLRNVVLSGYAGTDDVYVANLPQGIYFYQITEQGIIKASGSLTKH